MRQQIRLHLGKSDRDRAIAAWFDRETSQGRVVSDQIKDQLYRLATGQLPDLEYVLERLERIERLLRSGAVVTVESPGNQAPGDDIEGVRKALLSMVD